MSEKPIRKSPARLLLPIVQRQPEKTKRSVDLPQDVDADLPAYQRPYQEMTGAEVSLDFIIEHVLVHHLKRDKAFRVRKFAHRSDSQLQPRFAYAN